MDVKVVEVYECPEEPIAKSLMKSEWAVTLCIDEIEVRFETKGKESAWKLADALRLYAREAGVVKQVLPELRVYNLGGGQA